MKFIKKPIVVDAEQWLGQEMEGVHFRDLMVIGCVCRRAYLKTSMGDVQLKEGDWIVRDKEGCRFAYKPYIFEETYQKMDEHLQETDPRFEKESLTIIADHEL